MTLEITPETERVVREELASGYYQSIDDLILASVQALREQSRSREITDGPRSAILSGSEKARQFVEWARNHPSGQPLADDAISRANLNLDRW